MHVARPFLFQIVEYSELTEVWITGCPRNDMMSKCWLSRIYTLGSNAERKKRRVQWLGFPIAELSVYCRLGALKS